MVSPQWKDHIRTLLVRYARENMEFTANQAIKWCFDNGLPEPPHRNALGPMFRTVMVKENLVRVVASVPSDDPKAKGSKVALYRSTIYAYPEGCDVDVQLAVLISQFRTRKITIHQLVRQAYDLGRMDR